MNAAVIDYRKPAASQGLALAVIVAAQFMVVLDIAIVNVALPAIKATCTSRGKPAVGDQRLRDPVRRRPAAGRAAGRRVRPPAACS
jgi:hypothetical protein